MDVAVVLVDLGENGVSGIVDYVRIELVNLCGYVGRLVTAKLHVHTTQNNEQLILILWRDYVLTFGFFVYHPAYAILDDL